MRCCLYREEVGGWVRGSYLLFHLDKAGVSAFLPGLAHSSSSISSSSSSCLSTHPPSFLFLFHLLYLQISSSTSSSSSSSSSSLWVEELLPLVLSG